MIAISYIIPIISKKRLKVKCNFIFIINLIIIVNKASCTNSFEVLKYFRGDIDDIRQSYAYKIFGGF